MTRLVSSALDLLNINDTKQDLIKYKIAGLIIFDCLIDVSDEIMPERRIEIANHICKVNQYTTDEFLFVYFVFLPI